MVDRFYVPGNWSERVEIDGQEAQHLARVLRAKPGDQVAIFNGTGSSATAVIEEISKRTVTVRLLTQPHTDSPPHCEIVLAVAVPKGERLQWMIEKVTELGVDRLIPLSTIRSVVKPSDQKLHKCEMTVLAACKQSGRNSVMRIDGVCPLSELPSRLDLSSAAVWIGAPSVHLSSSQFPAGCYNRKQFVAVIGPEGGFTDEEICSLRQWGAREVSLSPYILRIETAAIAFAAALEAVRMGSNQLDL